MPEQSVNYNYEIELIAPGLKNIISGQFCKLSSTIKAVLEVSNNFPLHFTFENSHQFYFWSGTTAYRMGR